MPVGEDQSRRPGWRVTRLATGAPDTNARLATTSKGAHRQTLIEADYREFRRNNRITQECGEPQKLGIAAEGVRKIIPRVNGSTYGVANVGIFAIGVL